MGNGFKERSLIPVELTLSKSSSIVELNITDILLSPPFFSFYRNQKEMSDSQYIHCGMSFVVRSIVLCEIM